MGKFDARSDEGIFLGYSTKRKSYRICFNKRPRNIIERKNFKVDEAMKNSIEVDGIYVSNELDCIGIEEVVKEQEKDE